MTAVLAHERTVARPADSNYGPVRARDPRQVAEIRRRVAGGARPADLARELGLSARTVYRYVSSGVRHEVVELAGWRATFAVADGRAPWRVSRWIRVG